MDEFRHAPLPPDVPQGFTALLGKCLAKSAADRFPSAAHMSTQLTVLAEQSSSAVRLLAHRAVFVGTSRVALFINATNLVSGFRRGLKEAGYIDGQNVLLESAGVL